jgi:putative membrane protein
MSQAIAAYLHYLAIFVLFALLSLEHILFKLPLDSARARSLLRIDIAYGLCAGVVLLTGLARVIWYGKGWSYYLHNSVFHAKVGLFVLVGMLSIIPTLTFFEWRNALKAGLEPHTGEGRARLTVLVIRVELALLLVIPLLATLMARGFGMPG